MDSLRGKLRALRMRLGGAFGAHRTRDEFAVELESHLQMHIEDNLRSGMSPEQARRDAYIKLGGLEQAKQAYRERSTVPLLENLWQDIRYGLRMLARHRGFASVAILTLAVGLGTTTTVFLWTDSVLLRPLSGVMQPERLVDFETVTPNGEFVPTSYPDYQDFRDHLKLLQKIAVMRPTALSVGHDDHAERAWGELVSGNFFDVLGAQAEIGRVFGPPEYDDKPGAFPVVVLSDRYWRSHYAADPAIVGKTIRVNRHELTVLGVAAPEFHGSMGAVAFDMWVPYMQQTVLNGVEPRMVLRNRQNRNMLGIARLKPGVTLEQARQELAALAGRMAVANADVSEGMSATLLPLNKSPYGPAAMLESPLRILMGVCVLVLLIVCVNIANLLLARATVREKEFSMRLALGAGRARLMRQVLTESLLLTSAGGVLGLVAAQWMSHTLQYLMPPGQMILGVKMGMGAVLNVRVLAFTAGLCGLVALTAGLFPALQSSRAGLSTKLNEAGRNGAAGRHRNKLRSVLVMAEVALALVALIGAGLFARGFAATMRIDPGFEPNHVLLGQFYLATSGYDLEQRKEFCRRLQQKMEAAPGVVQAAYSDGVPLGFEPSWWEDLRVEGYTPGPGENMKIFRNVVSPDYLNAMRIPLVEGRNFTEHDGENAQPVMIVNEAFARRFFAGRDPVGHRIHGWGMWFRVVGVAKDSKYHYLSESPLPYTYFPFRQVYREDMNLAFYVRTRGNPEHALPVLQAKVHELDPNVSVFDVSPLREFIGASLYPQKVAASLLTVMGGLAVLLAAIGLYSVMAYAVAQRTQEIGVRMALGARRTNVIAMVVRQGLMLAGAGLAVGALLSLAMARSIATLSFTDSGMGGGAKLIGGSSVADPLIYVCAVVFLFAVAAAAAYLPARRASRIDPMQALRAE
ncbi:ABC transporter permease [Alloacidobacterium dinghuense]|uniref:ABC transporter permease n=1 Tax=Alloacidobacterium dinghuense TaxID=2763107 RepID=A0A7G8BG70_9BACT|nr:ABC transporter permease [Alloacidobacterium dinghuense]QNI31540.1 ABC transporter permease [Alloacidobacterium dinghuense]